MTGWGRAHGEGDGDSMTRGLAKLRNSEAIYPSRPQCFSIYNTSFISIAYLIGPLNAIHFLRFRRDAPFPWSRGRRPVLPYPCEGMDIA